MAGRRASVVTARGPLLTLQHLLAAVDGLLDAAVQDPAQLREPVWVVVASRAQREHVLARLAARRPAGAVLGVSVQTLWRTALTVLCRSGESPPSVGPFHHVLAARAAAGEPALAALEAFHEGQALVGATVEDFLDAGFTAGEEQRLLAAVQGNSEAAQRVRALIRVAAVTQASLERHGVDRHAGVYHRAAAVLNGGGPLPCRAVLLYGFADATGVAAAFLEALVRRGAVLHLDATPDPVSPHRVDPGVRFSRWFRGAAATWGGALDHEEAPAGGRWWWRQEPTVQDETVFVAKCIRELLDRGIAPEAIGVTARTLTPHGEALRRWFPRFGIPFSAAEPAVAELFPRRRRVSGALRLLADGADCPVEAWLAALGEGVPWRALVDDVFLGLRILGVATVADAAALDPAAVVDGRDQWPLPVRRGSPRAVQQEEAADDAGEGVDEEDAGTSPRRSLPGALLHQVRDAAATLERLLGQRPTQADLAGHGIWLRAWAGDGLGWTQGEVQEALSHLPVGPGPFVLTGHEFPAWVRRQWSTLGGGPLGGQGGGVRVLSITAARGLTFQHLFVMGLTQNAFPRTVREDPLLSDTWRHRLQTVLPALPLKKTTGLEEERYLFAQLLWSAPEVTLSWHTASGDGKPVRPSPLVERLRWHGAAREAPAPESPLPLSLTLPRCVHTPLPLEKKEPFHALAVRQAAVGLGVDPVALHQARWAVLREWETAPRHGAAYTGVSPWFGLTGVGPDIRLPVTTLEAWGGCPWRTFVEKVLRVSQPPDPLGALPTVSAALVGLVVHGALERWVRRHLPSGETPLDGPAVSVPRPGKQAAQEVLLASARAVAAGEGRPMAGYVQALCRASAPLWERAVALEWPTAQAVVPVVGVEMAHEVLLPGGGKVTFVADRVDRTEDGWVLTDYKSGEDWYKDRPLEKTRGNVVSRDEALYRDVAAAKRLQGVVYAHAATGAVGRYLFLGPDTPEDHRELVVRGDGGATAQALAVTLPRLVAAFAQGVFFPRVSVMGAKGLKDNPLCQWCDSRQTCVRQEATVKARLSSLMASSPEGATASQRLVLDHLDPKAWLQGQDAP